MYNVMGKLEQYLAMCQGAFGTTAPAISYIQGLIDARNACGVYEVDDALTSSGHPRTPVGYLEITKHMFGSNSRSADWIQSWISDNLEYADAQIDGFTEEVVVYTICRYHIGYDAQDEMEYVFNKLIPGYEPAEMPTSPISLVYQAPVTQQ